MGQQVSKTNEPDSIVWYKPATIPYTITSPGTSVTTMVMEINNKQYTFVETSPNKYQLSEYK